MRGSSCQAHKHAIYKCPHRMRCSMRGQAITNPPHKVDLLHYLQQRYAHAIHHYIANIWGVLSGFGWIYIEDHSCEDATKHGSTTQFRSSRGNPASKPKQNNPSKMLETWRTQRSRQFAFFLQVLHYKKLRLTKNPVFCSKFVSEFSVKLQILHTVPVCLQRCPSSALAIPISIWGFAKNKFAGINGTDCSLPSLHLNHPTCSRLLEASRSGRWMLDALSQANLKMLFRCTWTCTYRLARVRLRQVRSDEVAPLLIELHADLVGRKQEPMDMGGMY